ncbi:hypothetical protein CALCODRAFT_515273 [Calocera cornea HHB12733]|uniref:Uncharacterized protein n=1 Tax=Calocera cornea HHB12733 TaxID=1353952 RepID=A0A165IKA0_9BASI|nr:hypothetical protein CALCODRAFT_515273 [Calocera cornea HHB12733]
MLGLELTACLWLSFPLVFRLLAPPRSLAPAFPGIPNLRYLRHPLLAITARHSLKPGHLRYTASNTMTRFNHGYSVLNPPRSRPLMPLDINQVGTSQQQAADYDTYMDMYAEEDHKRRHGPHIPQFDAELQDAIIMYSPIKQGKVEKMWKQLEREEQEWRMSDDANPFLCGTLNSSAVGNTGRYTLSSLFSDHDDVEDDEDFLLGELRSDAAYMAACEGRLEPSLDLHIRELPTLPPSSSEGDIMAVDTTLAFADVFDSTMFDDGDFVDVSLSGSSSSSSSSLLSTSDSPFVQFFSTPKKDTPFHSNHSEMVSLSPFFPAMTSSIPAPDIASSGEAPSPLSATVTPELSSLLTPDDATFPSFLMNEFDGICECNTPSFASTSLPDESSSSLRVDVSHSEEESPISSARFPSSVSPVRNSIGLSFRKVPILGSPEKAELYNRRFSRMINQSQLD